MLKEQFAHLNYLKFAELLKIFRLSTGDSSDVYMNIAQRR